jgi:hypothetical protein
MGYLPDNALSEKEVKSKTYQKDTRYIELSGLGDGDELNVRPGGTAASGHVICAWQYFSATEKRTKRFPDFPADFADDIGLSFNAKNDGTKEKDKPKYVVIAAVLCKETGAPAILTIANPKAREDWCRTLSHEAYQYEDGALANFYITIRREGLKLETSYPMTPAPKAASAAERKLWTEVADSIWLPALFSGGDPFAGKPSEGLPNAQGLPPMARDETGADVEGAVPATGWV